MRTFFLYTVLAFAMSCTFDCLGQGHSLFWGTNTINVLFADTNLSPAFKESIVSDLQYCFHGWGLSAKIKLRSKENSAGYMDYGTVSPYYPEGLSFPNNIVLNANTGLALQVSEQVSDAYTNAMAFATANSNIVATACEFAMFVSSTNFFSVSSNQISNYVLFKEATPDMYQQSFIDITNSLRKQQYYLPGMLGFYYSSEGPGTTNLWVNIPSESGVGTSKHQWSPFPAIWHDGKWKFCFWDVTE